VKPGAYSIGSDHCPGLSKLIEECGELAQAAGKVMGAGGLVDHWDGTNLRDRLTEEIADVMAACAFVAQHNGLDLEAMDVRAFKKRELFEVWHEAGQRKEPSP
jgi:NTP pyrophosphatase (non-canonical NTP hydrolase)